MKNKIIPFFAAIFTVIVVMLGIDLVTNFLYKEGVIHKRGFILPVQGAQKTVASKEPQPIELGKLFAEADLAKGEKLFKRCATCHNAAPGAGNKVGPNLWNIVGSNKASNPSYDYSAAMKAKGGKWSYSDLFLFLSAPKKYVPGTKMGFPGFKNPQDTVDVILYLRSKSDQPAALPPKDATIMPN